MNSENLKNSENSENPIVIYSPKLRTCNYLDEIKQYQKSEDYIKRKKQFFAYSESFPSILPNYFINENIYFTNEKQNNFLIMDSELNKSDSQIDIYANTIKDIFTNSRHYSATDFYSINKMLLKLETNSIDRNKILDDFHNELNKLPEKITIEAIQDIVKYINQSENQIDIEMMNKELLKKLGLENSFRLKLDKNIDLIVNGFKIKNVYNFEFSEIISMYDDIHDNSITNDQFKEWCNIELCSEWGKCDKYGECSDKHFNELYDENIEELIKLDYTNKFKQSVLELACNYYSDSVIEVNELCYSIFKLTLILKNALELN